MPTDQIQEIVIARAEKLGLSAYTISQQLGPNGETADYPEFRRLFP